MNGIWRQVLVGSAVVMLLLALAALEILGEPGRAYQPTPSVSSPTSSWEDLLITQGDLLNFELGLTPSRQVSHMARLVEREGQ
jgi:hypothetical protein